MVAARPHPVLPSPRVPDPRAAPPLRWGVLGPGGIAAAFVSSLHRHTRQEVVAVGSRSSDRAERFARTHDIARAYGSYAALVADDGVDVVYVASPTGQHHEHAALALAAGRHVLVEKSFTADAVQAADLARRAEDAGRVLLEAMWTRFLPHIDVVRQLLEHGSIGPVSTVLADHGQLLTPENAPRLHRLDLAGGALLDLGVYPVSFAAMVLGHPDEVVATGHLAPSGVDAQIGAVLRTGTAYAVVSTTLEARTPTTASIGGPDGLIELAAEFYRPTSVTLTEHGRRASWGAPSITGADGLCYQAAHLAQLVADGQPASPWLPPAESVRIMQTLDEIRRQAFEGGPHPGPDRTSLPDPA